MEDDAPKTPQPKNPLHGVTLEAVVVRLVEQFGWPALGKRIRVQCFLVDPSVRSALTFLRKTPWARAKVEALYLETYHPPPGRRPFPSRR